MNQQNLDSDKLDRELDAALAAFAAVEPRPGLEERILASLRAAEQKPAMPRSWWLWPALGVTAVVIVLAIPLWRSGRLSLDITEHRPATTLQSDKQIGTRMANNVGSSAHPPVLAATTRSARHGFRHPQAIVASGPRLAQFPSLRPLREQEQLLVRFVQEFPEEAALIARAQAESEKEMEQLSGDQPSETNSNEQDQPQEK